MADQDTVDKILAMRKDIANLQGNVGDQSQNPARFPFIPELDFSNVAVAQPWTGAAISTGTATVIASIASHFGIVQVSNNSVANAGYEYDFASASSFLLAGGEVFEFVFRPDNVAGSNFQRYGFQDLFGTVAPVDGVWINISGATLTGKTSNNSVSSTTSTSYTVTISAWYHLKIFVNSTSLVTFSLYDSTGALVWSDTLTTNIPSTAGRETGCGIVGYRSTNTAGVNVATWDWMKVYWTTVQLR